MPILVGGAAGLVAVVALLVALTRGGGGGDELPDPAELVASVPLVIGGGEECGSAGSGSVVAEDTVLTNLHVVNGIVDCGGVPIVAAGTGEVRNLESEGVTADVVAVDAELDLAVLRVELPRSPSLELGDSADVATGDTIRVLGYPGIGDGFGDNRVTLTVTDGIVSGRVRDDFGLEYIKTDTDIAPGNSGGAAFASDGRLVGVPTVGVSDGATAIGGLRPIDSAKPLIQQAADAAAVPLDTLPRVPGLDGPSKPAPPDGSPESEAPAGGPLDRASLVWTDADGELNPVTGTVVAADVEELCILLDPVAWVRLRGSTSLPSSTARRSATPRRMLRHSPVGRRLGASPLEGGGVPAGSWQFEAAVQGRPETSVVLDATLV